MRGSLCGWNRLGGVRWLLGATLVAGWARLLGGWGLGPATGDVRAILDPPFGNSVPITATTHVTCPRQPSSRHLVALLTGYNDIVSFRAPILIPQLSPKAGNR
jgi:hypothetical protein